MSVMGALSSSVTAQQWSKVMETHSGYDLKLGPTNIDRLICDPKCFAFFLIRYKFAGKMLRRFRSILDVGCGDGLGAVSLLNETDVADIVGIDFEARNINYAVKELVPAVRALRPRDAGRVLTFINDDFMTYDWEKEFGVPFGGVACMDVIEHIEPKQGDAFIARLASVVVKGGIAVIGTPSLASQPFASAHSRAGHINLYDPDRFRSSLERQFRNVSMFSMNDEMVHTGFDRLAHYLIAVCVK